MKHHLDSFTEATETSVREAQELGFSQADVELLREEKRCKGAANCAVNGWRDCNCEPRLSTRWSR